MWIAVSVTEDRGYEYYGTFKDADSAKEACQNEYMAGFDDPVAEGINFPQWEEHWTNPPCFRTQHPEDLGLQYFVHELKS